MSNHIFDTVALGSMWVQRIPLDEVWTAGTPQMLHNHHTHTHTQCACSNPIHKAHKILVCTTKIWASLSSLPFLPHQFAAVNSSSTAREWAGLDFLRASFITSSSFCCNKGHERHEILLKRSLSRRIHTFSRKSAAAAWISSLREFNKFPRTFADTRPWHTRSIKKGESSGPSAGHARGQLTSRPLSAMPPMSSSMCCSRARCASSMVAFFSSSAGALSAAEADRTVVWRRNALPLQKQCISKQWVTLARWRSNRLLFVGKREYWPLPAVFQQRRLHLCFFIGFS